MILHRYFAKRYLVSFALVSAMFFGLLGVMDLFEQARDVSEQEGVTGGDIIALTLLNAPANFYEFLPLFVILSSVNLFVGLGRSSEMVVTRASGRSAIRALAAPVAVVTIIGLIAITVLNPLVAATTRETEDRVTRIEDRGASVLSVDAGGLWLRQGGPEGQSVIRAGRANLDGTELSGVSFILFSPEGLPLRRVDARRAKLADGRWTLTDAKEWPLGDASVPEAEATEHDTFYIASNLTAAQIRDSFGAPSSIPIWELPRFIDRLEAAGFSAVRHQVWLQSELAKPLFLIAMMLIGAAFTLRHQRGRRIGLMVLLSICLSFGLYFIRNFAIVLGENGQIPVALAAWAPPLAGVALSLAMLLHQEDG
ncbi:LPS export ABC transporter permease LptG [Pelagovum pacificum]|uniref:LPS export ABC transporter permease LptG n=1 Tax=Pelagovum pacificum TaxID=2588711 RepID=A0A5C5GCV0_9RHOB|nr:LPS export ABC transporter permease LptG [Pelagovum pacificum]QQA41388.1 LPS export ABC transporter permease LptG [Pelagovum pacificum]TNY31809.1 LPS export ABC transporter permease LptG [Pelagovum pacificum]